MLLRSPSQSDEDTYVSTSPLMLNEIYQNDVHVEMIDNESSTSNLLCESTEAKLMALTDTNDEQSKLLVKLVVAALQYSSPQFSGQWEAQFNVLKDMRRLMKEIQKDKAMYKKMAADFMKIVETFQTTMLNFQQQAIELHNQLEEVNIQFNMFVEIFLNVEERPLSDVNTESNMNLCNEILQNLSDTKALSTNTSPELTAVYSEISDFITERVEPAKNKAIEQQQRTRNIIGTAVAGGTGAGLGALVTGGLVAAPILGGVGIFTLGTIAFPPAAIIVGGVAIGLVGIGAIGYGISKLLQKYRKHRTTATMYLERLLELCQAMQTAVWNMKQQSNELAINADNFSHQVKCFRYGMHGDESRRAYQQVCRRAKQTNEDLMKILKSIIDFKLEPIVEIQKSLSNVTRQAICE
ncbi:unnamed protein product [Rotaria socialis]|nr:unnamed protein product [Rotaria socialis]CAF3405879.1 unnamed protein product [Rotaria socialis]CAF4653848.1 unnamed protein product [Rotaria socialis]